MNHAAATQELDEVMRRLEPEPEHSLHVAFLAVRLFDQLQALHQLGPEDRTLLDGAARLHDIGWPISKGGAAHHKLSARLIRRQSWTHLTPEEVETVAQVARYHRKALPCSEHVDFHSLPRPRQEAVSQLSALLRLADAFDRSHLQFVRDVRVIHNGDHLHFTLVSREAPLREIAGAEKKGNLARAIFRRELSFAFVPTK